jgi:hypothetical protein
MSLDPVTRLTIDIVSKELQECTFSPVIGRPPRRSRGSVIDSTTESASIRQFKINQASFRQRAPRTPRFLIKRESGLKLEQAVNNYFYSSLRSCDFKCNQYSKSSPQTSIHPQNKTNFYSRLFNSRDTQNIEVPTNFKPKISQQNKIHSYGARNRAAKRIQLSYSKYLLRKRNRAAKFIQQFWRWRKTYGKFLDAALKLVEEEINKEISLMSQSSRSLLPPKRTLSSTMPT